MEMSQEVARRKAALVEELERAIADELNLALRTHRASLGLMGAALTCSVAAGVLGFFTSVSSKVIGGIAILPPLIAFVAVNLKLEAKNSWHARMVDGLSGLRSRVLYQLPEVPTVDHIAVIAAERDKLDVTMQAEWDRTLVLNWAGLLSHQASSHPSDASSSTHSPGLPSHVEGTESRRSSRHTPRSRD
jgi:hypothetical protein